MDNTVNDWKPKLWPSTSEGLSIHDTVQHATPSNLILFIEISKNATKQHFISKRQNPERHVMEKVDSNDKFQQFTGCLWMTLYQFFVARCQICF